MFPILAGFQKEDATMTFSINLSIKEAIEAATDVSITLNGKPHDSDLQSWLKTRDELFQAYSKGNPNDLIEVRKFLISLLNFDMANSKPIAMVLTAKEIWYYQLKLHSAIVRYQSVEMLVKTTSSYCKGICEKFEHTAQGLEAYYHALFNSKLL